MINDVPAVLLSGAPAPAGLAVLYFASRNRTGECREIGFGRAMLFLFAGLLLIALPLVIWLKPFVAASALPVPRVSPGEVFLLAGYLDVALLWLIWSINSYAFRVPESANTAWEENWGDTYSPELKRRFLGPLLAQLDAEGKIGNLIVDVGSGANPVSQWLPSTPHRRFIHVDIAAKNRVSAESQYLRFNVENIHRPDLASYRKALVRVCRFLGIDAASSVQLEGVSTLVFSDILNYVDFRHVIGGFTRLLKPDGRIIIVNLPTRGIEAEFSTQGLKNNEALYPFLRELHLKIEYKDFPCRPADASEESGEMIVLVARKS